MSQVTVTSGAAGAAAARQAAIANATRAMGPIIVLEPDDWLELISSMQVPLIVHAARLKSGSFWKSLVAQKHRYLSPFNGLFIFTESPDVLQLPADAVLIEAKKLWVPSGV